MLRCMVASLNRIYTFVCILMIYDKQWYGVCRLGMALTTLDQPLADLDRRVG
jgi:hypothetical protein